MSKVMIHPATYENPNEAVERAFELFAPDLKNKKVFIKPNVLRASETYEGIVTHPALLRAVVNKVESMKPASITVGDNPGLFSYGASPCVWDTYYDEMREWQAEQAALKNSAEHSQTSSTES